MPVNSRQFCSVNYSEMFFIIIDNLIFAPQRKLMTIDGQLTTIDVKIEPTRKIYGSRRLLMSKTCHRMHRGLRGSLVIKKYQTQQRKYRLRRIVLLFCIFYVFCLHFSLHFYLPLQVVWWPCGSLTNNRKSITLKATQNKTCK